MTLAPLVVALARAPLALALLLACTPALPRAANTPDPAPTAAGGYYQCPGNVFTNTISAREAEQKGCKSRETSQPTTIPAPRPRPAAAAVGPSRPGEGRIEPGEQKSRDTEARRILETELKKSEDHLDALRKEFNNGEPERRGDERNYQRYTDRVADLKASIARTEADVAALKRELAKTP